MAQNTEKKAPWNAALVALKDDADPLWGVFSSDPTLLWTPLFSDQAYDYDPLFKRKTKLPPFLDGRQFPLLPSGKTHTFTCIEGGDLAALAFAGDTKALDALKTQGFENAGQIEAAKKFDKFPETQLVILRKQAKAGESIVMPPSTVLAGMQPPASPQTGEVLYNGIILPKAWPPRMEARTDEPPAVPYLQNPPKLIPIDVGRQLFIDDFLIERSTLTRQFHHPQKYEGNPVLYPQTNLEKKSRYGSCPVAAPLGGSIWWNPEKQLFEIWYEAGHITNLAYAYSKDGLTWERPDLDLLKGTNKIIEQMPDSWSVVLDLKEIDPEKRYKMLVRGPDMDCRRVIPYTSPDGIHWKSHGWGGLTGDRATFFYNPFRGKWVYSLRWTLRGVGRARAYWEADDFLRGACWKADEPVFWARTDKLDKQILPGSKDKPQLYNLDACAYESLMISFFQLHYGPDNNACAAKGLPKITGLSFAYSRDGFHWDRPDRRLAIESTQKAGDWDRGYVQSVGNLMAIRGDKLLIYYTAFEGNEALAWDPNAKDKLLAMFASGMHYNGAMGVAMLRRDGFASMNAGEEGGELTTRPLVFSGKHLFVNAAAQKGALLAQVTDLNGTPIPPFTFENCKPFSGDSTIAQIQWEGGDDLSQLAEKPVRLQFRLKNGQLYSFWVSRDDSGRSDGFVAGGGPGFTSHKDTVGKAAYQADAALEKPLEK